MKICGMPVSGTAAVHVSPMNSIANHCIKKENQLIRLLVLFFY